MTLTDFFDQGALSGGAFGTVSLEQGRDASEVVVKVAKASGGSRSNTFADIHHPELAYKAVALGRHVHFTLPASDVAQVLRSEAELLTQEGGHLLPLLHELTTRELTGTHPSHPAIVMERLRGRRPSSIDDLIRVLQCLAAASSAGRLGFHGDLKPEHIFIDDHFGVRLIDPAPRFTSAGVRAYTPEYNPHGIGGPFADVYSIAVMMYEAAARVRPFMFDGRPDVIIQRHQAILDRDDARLHSPRYPGPPPPVNRGRPLVDDDIARFIDHILSPWPEGVPHWAYDHNSALAVLVATTWKHVRIRRTLGADRRWAVTLVNARDQTPLTVQVGATTSWVTNAPGSDPPNSALCLTGSRVTVMRSLRALRRLPYVRNHPESGSPASGTFWSGQSVGLDIVLQESPAPVGDPGLRVPFETLTNPMHSLAYRPAVEADTEALAHILIEPDWGTSGLWIMHDDQPSECVDAIDLPISDELATRLSAWTEVLEDLRQLSDYPPEWRFATDDEERSWIDVGARTAAELQRELGRRFAVHYRIWGEERPFPAVTVL